MQYHTHFTIHPSPDNPQSSFYFAPCATLFAKRFLADADTVPLCDRLSGVDTMAAASTRVGRRDFETVDGHVAAGFSSQLMLDRDGTYVLSASGAISMSTELDVVRMSAAPPTATSRPPERSAAVLPTPRTKFRGQRRRKQSHRRQAPASTEQWRQPSRKHRRP